MKDRKLYKTAGRPPRHPELSTKTHFGESINEGFCSKCRELEIMEEDIFYLAPIVQLGEVFSVKVMDAVLDIIPRPPRTLAAARVELSHLRVTHRKKMIEHPKCANPGCSILLGAGHAYIEMVHVNGAIYDIECAKKVPADNRRQLSST